MAAILVLNADDFGLTEGHNRAIIEAHRHGTITSTSLLANGSAFDDAIALAQQHPTLGIGVHLSLIEGSPVATSVDELLTSKGRLPLSNQPYTRALFRGKLPYKAIRREFEAQIEALLDHGIQPTHMDGHRYIHLLPGITEIVIELALRYQIPVIRSLHRPADFRFSKPRRLISLLLVMALSQRAALKIRLAHLKVVDRSIGFMDTGHMNSAALYHWLGAPRSGVTELFCHPAYRTARIDEMLAEGYQRIDTFDFYEEVTALCDANLRNYLQGVGWSLRHFGNAFVDNP
jgi:chitin disaccharide deacetylase